MHDHAGRDDLLDALGCAVVAVASYNSGSDPATIGFDYAAGVIVTGLFVVTGLPALIIASLRRAPRTALALALAFPAVFVLLFVVTVIVFMRPM
jgi:predicted RNase H-like nuclease